MLKIPIFSVVVTGDDLATVGVANVLLPVTFTVAFVDPSCTHFFFFKFKSVY